MQLEEFLQKFAEHFKQTPTREGVLLIEFNTFGECCLSTGRAGSPMWLGSPGYHGDVELQDVQQLPQCAWTASAKPEKVEAVIEDFFREGVKKEKGKIFTDEATGMKYRVVEEDV